MIGLAGHLVFSTYGFWLPNDPRGSGSKFVGARHLLPFGRATGLEDRSRSVASITHDAAARFAAKRALSRPAVRFAEEQVKTAGDGFRNYVRSAQLTVWACAIMPDHVHMVVAKHRMEFEVLAGQLKNSATRALRKKRLHPFAESQSCWGERSWKTYLYSEAQILDRIWYVEENPAKAGLPRQTWDFVVPYPRLYPFRKTISPADEP